MHCISLGNEVQFFFAFRCIFLIKYFADIINNCIFVYQIKQKTKHYENNKQNIIPNR